MAKEIYEVGEILESYYPKRPKFGSVRWLITDRHITEHRGVFYDLVSLEEDLKQSKKSVSINTKHEMIQYRRLIDAIK